MKIVPSLLLLTSTTWAFSSLQSSVFHGNQLVTATETSSQSNQITMRKQKASDRRTRRRQLGQVLEESRPVTITAAPGKHWNVKQTVVPTMDVPAVAGGRQRSRKRSTLYKTLSLYHNHFVNQLTYEYQAEVRRRKRNRKGRCVLDSDHFHFLRFNS